MSTDDLPDPEDLDDEHALAFADPEDYTQNQRARALYQKRETAYEALTEWPGVAKPKEWNGLRRQASQAAANYALDCLEIADRLDEQITVEGPMADAFKKHYTNIRHFAILGGETDDDGRSAGPVSCRLVIAACDRFISDIGLGGKIDPGLDDDLL